MAKLHVKGVEVGLCDVKNRLPCIKTLLEKVVKVVGDTQLRENVSQFSHTVDCVWKPPRT